MRPRTRNQQKFKVRFYADCIVKLKEYLSAFTEAKESDKIDETELNEMFLNSIPNGWSKQAYVQGFYCEYITLKYLNIFECMEIAESIYEGFVRTCYKKSTRAYAKNAGNIRKIRGEAAS